MRFENGLFLFTQDLRVQDNLALAQAASQVSRLACIYVVDPQDFKPNRYTCLNKGPLAGRFLLQSLQALDRELCEFGQHLNILIGRPLEVILEFIQQHGINYLAQSAAYGVYEQRQFNLLQTHLSDSAIAIESNWQHTLFDETQLPFDLQDSPKHFTPFRKTIEAANITLNASNQIVSLPPPLLSAPHNPDLSELTQFAIAKLCNKGRKKYASNSKLTGGCKVGEKQLNTYFSSKAPLRYKQTRNEIDYWTASSKLSPWLANGCLSPRQVWHAVEGFEHTYRSNESTYWLKFELLWREFYHWQLQIHQQRFFIFSGCANKKPLTTYNAERFRRWTEGNTPYPIVNAIMHQLNKTGFISNRARQISASCWLNEMQGDWRFGAAYFQQQLIDYDVAANWGNWQYLAGVGADPRGGRWFDLQKQTELYDPEGLYIEKWRGWSDCENIDSVDIVDWPIESDKKALNDKPPQQ